MILSECLSELSKLERHEQNLPALARISRILETSSGDDNLAYLIVKLPDQNKATIRVLWRQVEKILLDKPEHDQRAIILKSFELADTVDEKSIMLNLIFTNGRNLFHCNAATKIDSKIWNWLIDTIINSIENIEERDFLKMAFLVKVINQVISHNGQDLQMMDQFRIRLKTPLKNMLMKPICQLNVEFMSSGNCSKNIWKSSKSLFLALI